METKLTRWEWHHNNFTPPPCLAILPTIHTTKLSTYTCTGLFTPTKWLHNYTPSTIHFCIQDNPYVPCSGATKVHNITDPPTCCTDPALLMHSTASAYQIDHICHAHVQQLSCNHPQHNSLHIYINMHSTPSTTHPTAFHNPTTNKCKA